MTEPIRTVLFDIDGTLLDTREFVLRAFEHALGVHGQPTPPRHELTLRIGPELGSVYDELCGPALRDDLVATHRAFQSEHLHLVEAFAGAGEVLRTLAERDIGVATVTNRSARTARRSLEVCGLGEHVDVVVAAEDVTNVKPHPEPLLLALERLGHDGGPVAMVGDTAADIGAGHAIGALTVAATYGFHGRAVLDEGPDHEIGSVPELLALLGVVADPAASAAERS